jgi:hypothetical protein
MGMESTEMLPMDAENDQDIEMDELKQAGHTKNTPSFSLLGFNKIPIVSPLAFPRDKVAIGKFCRAYLQNVDPIIKILHRPSLSRWMLQGEKYLGYPEEHTSVMALESAVCYVAATSLTNTQCKAMFQMNKAQVTSTTRGLCESAIERANLLTTRDKTVLQAFVLYLVSCFQPRNTLLEM